MDTNITTLAEQMGIRTRQARLQAGLSLDDVAQVLDISTCNLAAVERGELKLAAAQVVDLCDLFNKRPSWLFDA